MLVRIRDNTYIRTWEGWLYLATVIDVASRRVVGWSMADDMRAELVCDALGMAIEHRRPGALIFHSDRGCQYTSGEFASLCEDQAVTQSMSRPGQCWDKRGRGDVCRSPEKRVDLPQRLGHPGRGPPGHLRVHRGVLQPPETAQFPQLPLPGEL